MAFKLPELTFPKDALAPHISAETLDFHHGKHHAAYVNNLNAFVDKDPSLAGKSLEDIIRSSSGGVFNNAAQVWNHSFYWKSLGPSGGGEPHGKALDAVNRSFGSFADFKAQFTARAVGHFGAGWIWVVKEDDGLAILDTHDAGSPLTLGKKPVLTCDVWEHAYYVDYRNARPKYVEAWFNLVNWDFASENL